MKTIYIASSTARNKRADLHCTGTNDEVVINSAISTLSSTGGIIILSEGVFNIGDDVLINSSNITIEGQGVATKIYVQNGANLQAAISIVGSGLIQYGVRRLMIDGNSANQTNGSGIYVSTPWVNGSFDPNGVFEDIYIKDVKNNGFEVGSGGDTRVMHLKRVRVRDAKGNGFFFPAPSCTDSIIDDCIAETCSLNGFYLGCLNTHFINCKAFWCGSAGGNNHGFYIAGYNNFFENCESQDNYQSGFYTQNDGDATYGSQYCTLVNCIGDSNGQNGGTTYAVGLQIKNTKGWQIIGGQFITRPYPSFTQRVGILLEGTTTETVVVGSLVKSNSSQQYQDTSSGTNYPLGLNGYVNSQLPGKLLVKGQVIASGGFVMSSPVTLTDAATVNTDASKSNLYYLSLGGNRTIANPTNMADGQEVTWRIKPNGFTPTFGSAFNFGVLTYTPSGGYDYIKAIYNNAAAKWDVLSISTGY